MSLLLAPLGLSLSLVTLVFPSSFVNSRSLVCVVVSVFLRYGVCVCVCVCLCALPDVRVYFCVFVWGIIHILHTQTHTYGRGCICLPKVDLFYVCQSLYVCLLCMCVSSACVSPLHAVCSARESLQVCRRGLSQPSHQNKNKNIQNLSTSPRAQISLIIPPPRTLEPGPALISYLSLPRGKITRCLSSRNDAEPNAR